LFYNSTFSQLLNCRTLSNGQRGEIYEINGDQVAVIFDPPDEKLADGPKDEANEDAEEEDAKSSVYWVDSMYSIPSIPSFIQFEYPAILTMVLFVLLAQDIAHDHDTQAEDWHIAIEAFCEVNCHTICFVRNIFLFLPACISLCSFDH
jgi:hypothetical protein